MFSFTQLDNVEQEVKRRAELLFAAERSPRLQKYCIKRSRHDFWFWAGNFVWVLDPEKEPNQQPYSLRWKHFQHEMVDLWPTRRDFALEKSREVGASVQACLCATHNWLFRRQSHQVFVSLKAEKVCDNTDNFNRSLFGKIRWIVRHLPVWMRPSTWRTSKRARFDDRHMLIVNPDIGSQITGQSTSPDAVRGERAMRLYVDEANSIDWLDDLLMSAQRVGPVGLTSSVKGRMRPFARITHGDTVEIHPYGSHEDRDGWVKLRWHYSDRPDRDPTTAQGAEWKRREKAKYTPEAWAQELEIDYMASSPGRIWGDYFDPERHIMTDDEWSSVVERFKPSMRLIEGWDFGSGEALTAVVWAWHSEATDCLYVEDFHEFYRSRAEEVAGVVRAKAENLRPGTIPDLRIGDLAGRQKGPRMQGGRLTNPVGSWIGNLRDLGIDISGRRMRVEESISNVVEAFYNDRIFFHERCGQKIGNLPSLIDCVTQYRRNIPASMEGGPEAYAGDTPKPLKDIYSHASDALQHVAWEAWPRNTAGTMRG